jgi:hypothetical protein
MSPVDQQIAIAEACGRCPHVETKYYCIEDGNSCDSGFTCVKCGENPHSSLHQLPDYLSDLNAMHEAEKVLTFEQQIKYATNLYNIIAELPENQSEVGGLDVLEPLEVCSILLHATATQRAEAFLRTLNLWDDSR